MGKDIQKSTTALVSADLSGSEEEREEAKMGNNMLCQDHQKEQKKFDGKYMRAKKG